MLRQLASWSVGLLLVAAVARKVDWSRAAAAAARIPPGALLLTVAGLAASYAFRALRMRAELGRGRAVPRGSFLGLMLVHNAAVNVVPLRGGDAAYPLLVHRRLGIPVVDAVGSLLWMRAQDALVLALLATLLWPNLPPAVRGAGAIAAVGAMALLPRALLRLARWAAGTRRTGSRWEALRAASGALARAPQHGLAGWLFCLASWSCKLAAVALCLGAAAHLPAGAAAAAALGGELAGALPLQGPAGFGTYEAGVWAGAALHGVRAAEVALAGAAVHAVMLVTALAGGALAHLRSPSLPSPAAPGATS